ncbi:hypothetical protein SAMN05444000_1152 [Shimia gijangensis]|uniref:Uncharacterized protein n=1 Tax=Shimia gijangensis TaxID=1470563 RepID=A0A1M6N146_9RHOB|nr:hypothetical protein [Shimia gijangensis]SHJ89430.1 hypothetical protein SAMN05444000_1152 [Shimia gijangensis]
MTEQLNQTQIDAILARHESMTSIIADLRMEDDHLEQLELLIDVFGADTTFGEAIKRQATTISALEERLIETE